MYTHASNNKVDRKLGEYWERRFCIWAAKYNKSFTPMQIDREKSAQAFSYSKDKYNSYTLPDITVWTSPGEHHEIKHKNPIKNAEWYGLEKYRFDALLWFAKETNQDVMYTIHNHDLSGGRDSKIDQIEHWFTINVLDLVHQIIHEKTKGTSYVNGMIKHNIHILFWDKNIWFPLEDYWKNKIKSKHKATLS